MSNIKFVIHLFVLLLLQLTILDNICLLYTSTLTLCYFDTSALLLDLLSEDEKKWLNDYHKTVYEKTAPYLTPEEAQWLAEKTKPVL